MTTCFYFWISSAFSAKLRDLLIWLTGTRWVVQLHWCSQVAGKWKSYSILHMTWMRDSVMPRHFFFWRVVSTTNQKLSEWWFHLRRKRAFTWMLKKIWIDCFACGLHEWQYRNCSSLVGELEIIWHWHQSQGRCWRNRTWQNQASSLL